mgnify:CR=1 FL=1
MFILSCSAALAFGLFPFAAGQSVASGDRGKMETAPRPGLECLQVTLLIRQMVLDRYDTTGTGILSEQDKARLVEDARSARREARKAFLRKFDKGFPGTCRETARGAQAGCRAGQERWNSVLPSRREEGNSSAAPSGRGGGNAHGGNSHGGTEALHGCSWIVSADS